MRDVVALICTVAVLGIYVQYFLNGKEPSESFLLITIGAAIGSICSKLLKPKSNGV